MLKYEPGTRLGEDIEALHDMRVATRRMRAAFNLFGISYKKKVIKPFLAGLKLTGRALGPVRDLDVFMEKLRTHQQSLPGNQRKQFQLFLDIWASKRESARARMLAYLDGKQYKSFKKRFLKFVTTDHMGAKSIPEKIPPVPYQLRHIVPELVYSAHDQVRAYETILGDAPIETLHQLRISFKGLRYRLEFMHEILGDECNLVIEEVKAMQDHLGDLNDADVAISILRNFLEEWEGHQQRLPLTERQPPTSIVQYLNERIEERHRLLMSFPDAWERLTRPEVREHLACAISVL
jgi:CHAD domain-containing protein